MPKQPRPAFLFAQHRQSQDWQSDLQSSATLQVLPDSEDELQKALDILTAQPGIMSAQILSEKENRDLLKPWIGEINLPDDIAVPVLIKVTADFDKLDEEALQNALAAADIIGEFDNHQQWNKNLVSTWVRFRLALIALLLVILSATVAISSFATQSVLGARQNIIRVLGQVGATDQFISALFTKRFLSLGFKAAVTGTVLALLFVAGFMLWQNLGTDQNGLKIGMETSDVIWLFALSLTLGIISALTAGRSARRSIRAQRPDQ